MTLQHEKVVKGSLRSQNMKKKKLLAAMSSFEVSLKSMESTLYSLPDTCEAGKKTTIALNQSLRWRYFPWVGNPHWGCGQHCPGERCRTISDWQCNTGKAQLAEPKLTLMVM